MQKYFTMEYYNDTLSPEILQKRFPSFEPELTTLITQHGKWASVEQGENLMSAGQSIQFFPLVLDGLLRIYRNDDQGRETQLYYLQRGEVCAMALTCCTSGTKASINAIAEADTDVMLIPVKYIDQWSTDFPSWKHFMMSAYKDRFDELIETIDSLAFKKMDERLISFFNDYQQGTGKTCYTGTHEEIARALTSSREVISRLLKALEKQGRVTLSRNKVDFTNLL